jgi:phosphoenolpyruvate carboxykinase (ATP)
VLNPRSTWDNPQAYDEAARSLADMFVENFEKYTRHVDASILQGGPVSASIQS